MDNNIKFSIIIPAYNAEKYISQCLKSVINQTYDNYEAIVIDDGSTDRTGIILDKFSRKYKSIKVIHQSNSGVFQSRKNGISVASGEYITFLDADDWYDSDLLSVLYNKISKVESSIIQFGYNKIRFGFKKAVTQENQIINNDINLIKNFINGHGIIDYALCDKVYKKDIILKAINHLDSTLRMGEDGYLNLVALSECQGSKISVIDKSLYNYRQGSGITSSKDIAMLYNEIMKYKNEMYRFIKARYDDKSIMKSIFIDSAFITQYYSHLITENEADKQQRIKLLDEIVLNNPTISSFIAYYSNDSFDNPQCTVLLKNNAEEYCEFIDNSRDDNNLTITQKIIRILNKLQ